MDPAFDPTAREAPLDQLERALINEDPGVRGYDSVKLATLPEVERTRLLREASVYASAKLAEIEARSHVRDELHGALWEIRKDIV